MNYWTERSFDIAETSNYLDRLFKVYPISENEMRPLDNEKKTAIMNALTNENKKELILECITSDVSPIKDSYIGFIKKDNSSLDRNPETLNRLYSILRDMGFNEIIKNMERPAEANRQMGQAFHHWIDTEPLGIKTTSNRNTFIYSKENMILSGSDKELGEFARIHLGYGRNRGLDFLCRFNGKYVIGEAKFITSDGGNQSNQFDKALDIFTSITTTTKYEVKPIAILDGVIYIRPKGNNQSYAKLKRSNEEILSALLLRDYLYSL